MWLCISPFLSPLTAPQPHSLAVLLQLSDKLIALPDYILILLVLVVWAIRLDDAAAVNAVDSTGDAARGDESSKIPISSIVNTSTKLDVMDRGIACLPVKEIHCDAKVRSHAVQADDTVTLQKLLVCAKTHLTDEPALVLVEVPVLVEELLLNGRQGCEECFVIASV